MITLANWVNDNTITDADMGASRSYTDFPKQFPCRKAIIILSGNFNITAGGAVDYTAGTMMVPRIIKNIQFKLGGNNLLKDVPGYLAWFNTQLLHYSPNYHTAIAAGTALTPVNSYFFQASWNVDFSDYNTIYSDATMLYPWLYKDISIKLDFSTMAELCPSVPPGDRPFNMNALLQIIIEQENNPVSNPSDILREYILTHTITSAGVQSIDLPTDAIVERFSVALEQDNLPNIGIIDPDLSLPWQIDVESGRLLLYNSPLLSLGAMMGQDSGGTSGLGYITNENMNDETPQPQPFEKTRALAKKYVAVHEFTLYGDPAFNPYQTKN